ncbi:MAG: hypothetical protein IJK60_03395 [Clostridia bacterium]|nr:hypothetical protein [Clostridia bacterium]
MLVPLGADDREISAHEASAPDHEPIQGRQYRDDEYIALNNSLVRRIGTLNCKHIAFPIKYGVTKPVYSAAELEEMKKRNAQGITYQGKHYTLYEATQQQRAIERAIRKQKRKIIAAEATGDQAQITQTKAKLTTLFSEYNRFSKAAGLLAQYNRFEIGEQVKTSNIPLKNAMKSGIMQTNKAKPDYKRITQVRASIVNEKIESGEYSTKLSHQQHLRHTEGTSEFEKYKQNRLDKGGNPQSIITISEEDTQKIIISKAGTGIIKTTKKGMRYHKSLFCVIKS